MRPADKAGQVVLLPAATLRPISGFVLGKCVCREGPLRVVWGPDGDPDLSGFPPDADVGALSAVPGLGCPERFGFVGVVTS